jgi:hypothetical protein
MTLLPLPLRTSAAQHWYDRWFEPELPGPATLAEHVLATGCGGWWTDDLRSPRVVLVRSGSQRVLRGDPARMPDAWVPLLARGQIGAPARFTPLLAGAFRTFTPWRRTVLVRWEAATTSRRPPDPSYLLRRLRPDDATSLVRSDPALHWIWETWGSPATLARCGGVWGAFGGGTLVSIACTYLRGRDHEDVAVATAPLHRRRGLAAALAVRLAGDIRARGRDATWTAPTSNAASLGLAAALGFRAMRTEIAYWVGDPVAPSLPHQRDERQVGVKSGAARV